MQTIVNNGFFIVVLLAIWLGPIHAHAFKPAKRPAHVSVDGFTDSYGKAFLEYTRRVNGGQGVARVSQDERQRLYDELFSEPKKAFEKEKNDTKRRLVNIGQNMNRSISSVRSGGEIKTAIASAEAQNNQVRAPAAVSAPAARNTNTGEIGKAGGADEVQFGKQKSYDPFGAIAPSNHEPDAAAPNTGGAQTVSFSGE